MNSFCKITFLFLFLTFFCSSCATIFNGTKQRISIDSKPRGATVKIHDQVIGTTPLSVKQPTKKPLSIVFSLQGYEDRMYVLDHKYEWRWLLLDVPFTFPYVNVPFAIDVISQSPYRFVQKEVIMNFDSAYTAPLFKKPDDQVRLAIQPEEGMLTEEELKTQREDKRKMALQLRQARIEWERKQDSIEVAHRMRRMDSSRVKNYRLVNQYKNELTIQLLGLFVSEVDISYYRNVYKGVSVGLEFGYKASDKSTHAYNNEDELNINGPVTEMMRMPFTESYYVGLGTKIPLHKWRRGDFYLSFVGFARNASYNHAQISWHDQTGKSEVTRYQDSVSVDQNTQGLKCLFGLYKIVPLGKVGLVFNLYAGMSWRRVTTEIYHYQKSAKGLHYNTNSAILYQDQAEKDILFYPTPQLGVSVGVRF